MRRSTQELEPRKARRAQPGTASVTRGNGNVFADLGFDAPDDELAKATLVVLIERRVAELGLTQAKAAIRMGTTQPKVSRILRGDTSGVSTAWLMTALVDLGRDVEICVRPAAAETGRLYVHAMKGLHGVESA